MSFQYCLNFLLPLTHFLTLVSIPWKHRKIPLLFSIVFRGYRRKPVTSNGLIKKKVLGLCNFWWQLRITGILFSNKKNTCLIRWWLQLGFCKSFSQNYGSLNLDWFLASWKQIFCEIFSGNRKWRVTFSCNFDKTELLDGTL